MIIKSARMKIMEKKKFFFLMGTYQIEFAMIEEFFQDFGKKEGAPALAPGFLQDFGPLL